MRQVESTIYEPRMAPSQRIGWRAMLGDLSRTQDLVRMLIAREFRSKYRESLLGYVWILLPPILGTVFFTLLVRQRVIVVEETGLPYPVFVLLGLTFWGLVSGVLSGMSTSLTAAANLIQKMNFPREALPVASLARPLYETAIRIGLLVVVVLIMQASLHWTALLIPLLCIPLLCGLMAIGLLLAVFNALARDAGNAIALVLQFGLFLTPILYPAPQSWPFMLINYLNPLSPFVIAAQDLAGRGYLTLPIPLAFWSVCSMAGLLLSWRVFHYAQPIIGERI